MNSHFEVGEATDGQLLARFAQVRDERAFEEIVRRHGRMVHATASRLVSTHDADDVGQAAFFALARLAEQLGAHTNVAAWLHETTRRVAKSFNRAKYRHDRKIQEARGLAMSIKECAEGPTLERITHHELIAVLDEELSRLPPELKSVVMLCDLEGVSHRLAADRLGIAASTVSERVGKGRKLLHQKLSKRGVSLTLAALVTQIGILSNASPVLSAIVVTTTTRRAVLFAAGKSAQEIGVSSLVTHAAGTIIASMKATRLLTIVLVTLGLVAFGGHLAELLRIPTPLRHQAAAQVGFYDDFSDGNASDGSPVTWDPSWSGSTLKVEDGSMIVANDVGLASAWVREEYTDVSIRARMRLLEGHGIGLQARLKLGTPVDNYFSLLEPDGTLRLMGHRPFAAVFEELGSIDTSLDPFNEDIMMRLDVVGSELRLWAWAVDEEMPTEPLVAAMDDRATVGYISVYSASVDDTRTSAAFRFVQATVVPEPSALTLVGTASFTCACLIRHRTKRQRLGVCTL